MSRATPSQPQTQPQSQPQPQTQASPQTASQKFPHDKIAMRAYEKWCKRGRPMGNNPEQDWLEAERELAQEFNRGSATPAQQRR